MSPDYKNSAILVVLFTLITLIVVVWAYEEYQSHQYELWKLDYRKKVRMRHHGPLVIRSSNSELQWEYRPNGEYTHPASKTSLRTNKYGFRQHENTSPEKQDGILRFSFIGDSVTLGLKVDYEDTFVVEFQDYANKSLSNPNIETLNFGVGGYNTVQIQELLQTKVLRFSPDVVIYVMCLNDFDFAGASGGLIRYFNKPKSFLLEMLEKFYIRAFSEYHAYYFNKNKQVVIQSILAMRDLLADRGIKYYVAILPIFSADNTSFEGYPLARIHEQINETLLTNNIRVIDLLPQFRKESNSPRFYASDIWHPNRKGHRLIAHHLVNSILH